MSEPQPAATTDKGAVRTAKPRFVTGSIQRHILVMTGTAAIGLMAVFIAELLSLVFLGLLRDVATLAAIGYAMTIQFFSTSVGIGLSIATISVVSPAAGRGDLAAVRRIAVNAHLTSIVGGVLIALAIWPFIDPILSVMGATGRTHELAASYLRITMTALPLTCLGMCSMAVLRSLGDAERSMSVSLVGAAVNVAVEPFLIFILKLGIVGSALAHATSRVAFVIVGAVGVFVIHRVTLQTTVAAWKSDARVMARVAVPAVLTNIATPIANTFTTAMVARHGDSAMAAWAIVGRITPVAFGAVFCLSGAVGPIIGQNYGAGINERVRETLNAAYRTNLLFCAMAWAFLVACGPTMAGWFALSAEATALVRFYCLYVAPLFLFLGMLFVSTAAFNTLGYPRYGTALNWGRATLGTIPLTYAASRYAGAEGVFMASVAGAVLFGGVAAWLSYRVLPDRSV